MMFATYGLTTKLTAGKAMLNLPKGKRLAIAANKLFTINPSTKTAIRTVTKKGLVTKWVSPTGPWKNATKLKILGLSLTKAGYLETAKGALSKSFIGSQPVSISLASCQVTRTMGTFVISKLICSCTLLEICL